MSRASTPSWKVVLTVCLLLFSLPCAAGGNRVVSASSGQRYELGRLIGRGGFGRVYKAWPLDDHEGRGAPVVVKQYDSLATAISEHEVHQAINGLSRLPHAVGDGFDRTSRKNFLISRWMTGRTLEKWSAAKARSTEELVAAVAEAARVVSDLNAHGWLHLDLHPKNIMIDRQHRVNVIDLGISQRKGPDGTVIASGAGTRKFMPPEQRTKAAVGDRADVFALTGTLYRLLAHKNPIADENDASSVITNFDDIANPALRAILTRGLARNPVDRYESAAALADALSTWHRPSQR